MLTEHFQLGRHFLCTYIVSGTPKNRLYPILYSTLYAVKYNVYGGHKILYNTLLGIVFFPRLQAH